MIKFWEKDTKDKPAAYRGYMARWDDDYAAVCNADLDTWRIDPDHETSRGYDKEALIELILKIGYPPPRTDASEGVMQRAGDAPNETIWVLKALHQRNNPHITLGLAGLIYHADVGTIPGPYLSIIDITLAPGQRISAATKSTNWRKN